VLEASSQLNENHNIGVAAGYEPDGNMFDRDLIPTSVLASSASFPRAIDLHPVRRFLSSAKVASMEILGNGFSLWRSLALALAFSAAPLWAGAQASVAPAAPDWAQPGSTTHTQVAPPPDFHRASTNFNTPIGIFDGQSDIGSALVPGSASYDPATKQYTINSAGYNIWYTRDEFRFLWKKMKGDISLAGDIAYPNPKGYGDRKAVLVIRQSLDDDAKEAVVALHGAGMIHLAYRPEKDLRMRDMEYRIGGRGLPGGATPDSLVPVYAQRIGIEKRGDAFALFVSLAGEPMHQFGPPITLHFDEPFYVGIGFCPHLPATVDTAIVSNVVLENAAGKVR
jgi:hypothetical protein